MYKAYVTFVKSQKLINGGDNLEKSKETREKGRKKLILLSTELCLLSIFVFVCMISVS